MTRYKRIVEKEELVNATYLPQEEYLKNERPRRLNLGQGNENSVTLKRNLDGGCFMHGLKPISLKGGADHDNEKSLPKHKNIVESMNQEKEIDNEVLNSPSDIKSWSRNVGFEPVPPLISPISQSKE